MIPGAPGTQVWLSFLAPVLRPLYALCASQVAAAAAVEVDLRQGRSYRELAGGDFDFAFVCGLPFVELVDSLSLALEPVVAPVLLGERYGGRAVYFSDVVVPAGSPARAFTELRGARWAFNEHGSHSGYLATLGRLAGLGEDTGFFREWVPASFHERAIGMVAAGEVDAAAIDSQVLAVVLDREPGLRGRLRVIDSLGPSPIQPLVAAPRVTTELRALAAAELTAIGENTEHRGVLEAAHVDRFVPVVDSDYDPIRRMLDRVRMAGLWNAPRPEGLEAPTG